MFSCEFCEISKNTFFIEHLWWLLLEDVLDDFWMSYVMYDVRPTCRVLSTYPQNWINENVLLFSVFFCVSFNLKREVCKYARRCLDGNLFRDLIHHAWKVPIFGVILVRIFPHSDWIRRGTCYLSIFSLNAGKYGPE